MKKIYLSISICSLAFMNAFAQSPCQITLSSAAGTNSQSVCKNTAITNITFQVSGTSTSVTATLPAGVISSYNANVFTISGAPTVEGIFDYTVTTTGGCSPDSSLTGSITIISNPPVGMGSLIATECINTPMSPVVYNNNGISPNTVSALPAGVFSVYDSINKQLTINGSPSVQGVFNYSVTSHGPCGYYQSATGSITVNVCPCQITLTSVAGTNTQTVCKNTAIINITYQVSGTNASVTATLPVGVTSSYNANVFTISGAPQVEGTFNYTVTTTGGCSPDSSVTGSINSLLGLSTGPGNITQTVCINTPITPLVFNNTGISPATVSALPAGLSSVYDSITKQLTISGSPSLQGVFNYTVTTRQSVCGSYTSDYVTTTVNALPIVTANASAKTLCAGASVTLTGSGATSYSWSSGGSATTENMTPFSNTTYTVIGTDANNCSNTDAITISVNALPNVIANASANTVCAGTSVTLTASGATTYSWSSGGSAATENVMPSSNTTYTVSGTDVNNCSNTATQMITVSLCNGVETIDANRALQDITIYPNPNNGTFIIESTSEGVYSIINELGQIIQRLKLNSTNKYSINIENLSNGIYFIIGFNPDSYRDRTTHQKIVVIK